MPVALHAESEPRPHIREHAPEQLSDLQSRARRIAAQPLLQHPAGLVLKQLAETAVSALRDLHREIRDSARSNDAPAQTGHIDVLFRRAHLIFDQIESHVAAVDALSRSAIDLAEAAAALLDRKPANWPRIKSQMQKLAGHPGDSLNPAFVWPGFISTQLVAAHTGRRELAGLVRGIQTARVVECTLRSEILWADRLPLLVSAAMLQDIGTLQVTGLLAVERRKGTRLKERLSAMHPLISAAAAGGIADAPVELASLIAQHHERCDGSGYPRCVGINRISPPARLLAAANRLVELGEAGAAEGKCGTESAQLAYALNRLSSEADEGCWDLQFVRLIDNRWRPLVTGDLKSTVFTDALVAERLIGDFGEMAADGRDAALRLDRRELDLFARHTAGETPSRRPGSVPINKSHISYRHD